MKKEYKHTDLSDKMCKTCGKKLKKRLEHFDICYNCYRKKESQRGHYINANPRKSRLETGLSVKKYLTTSGMPI